MKIAWIKLVFLTNTILMTAYQANASSYQDVHDVVFSQSAINNSDDEKVRAEKSVYLADKLPAYKVTSSQFTKKAIQQLENRTKKTLVDKVDYYNRLEKLVHSNGICMAGSWYITEEPKNTNGQSYTGLFAKGTVSPFIGRLSVSLSDTKQGTPQGFGMAGKLFGTSNISKNVMTQNFFVADVLAGRHHDSVFTTSMTNSPKVGFRFSVIGLGLKIASLFKKADKNPSIRPVKGIAKMGLADNDAIVSPKFMMVLPIKPDDYEIQKGIDFRDEFALSREDISSGISRYFSIYVSDTSNKPKDNGWQHIGFIKANETVVSYGCDRQLHFAHPRDDSHK